MQNNAPLPERVLIIAAHPDDIEFTCAATVAKWTDGGSQAYLVLATSGDKGTKDRSLSPHRLAEIREAESLASAEVLDISDVIFLRKLDGEVEADLAFRNQLSALIRSFAPDVLLTHDPWRRYQIHPDHRAVGTAAVDAVVTARDHLYVPEQLAAGLEPHHVSHVFLFSTDSPDHLEDVSDFMDKKLEALGCHASQVGQVADWRDRVTLWAEQTGELIGVQYAEAFKHLELR